MTAATTDSADMDPRRRRALFRSWHRGIREMDLILGGFADEAVAGLTDAELEHYEALLEAPDADLMNWLTGQAPLPTLCDTPVFRKILATRRAMTF